MKNKTQKIKFNTEYYSNFPTKVRITRIEFNNPIGSKCLKYKSVSGKYEVEKILFFAHNEKIKACNYVDFMGHDIHVGYPILLHLNGWIKGDNVTIYFKEL